MRYFWRFPKGWVRNTVSFRLLTQKSVWYPCAGKFTRRMRIPPLHKTSRTLVIFLLTRGNAARPVNFPPTPFPSLIYLLISHLFIVVATIVTQYMQSNVFRHVSQIKLLILCRGTFSTLVCCPWPTLGYKNWNIFSHDAIWKEFVNYSFRGWILTPITIYPTSLQQWAFPVYL